MGELAYYIQTSDGYEGGKKVSYAQGYDNAGNPVGEKTTIPYSTQYQEGQSQYEGTRVYPQSRKEEVTQFFKNKVAGQEYGAPSINAQDFLTPDGKPISANDAVAKWKELFPDTKLDDAAILAKVKDEMPRFEAVKQEEKDFARQGFKKDMYGLQAGAQKAGQQMASAYGSGMGTSIRGAIGGQKNVAQGFQQAEQAYKQDIYNLEQKAESSYESDLATFASTFKRGGLVPNKKEETFLDVLARIPDAKGS